jgi:hypothetical protein
MLGYGEQSASFRYLCESHGIQCDVINDRLVLNRANRRGFSAPESRIISRESYLIESKLHTSVSVSITVVLNK